jgi:hypothetical protein
MANQDDPKIISAPVTGNKNTGTMISSYIHSLSQEWDCWDLFFWVFSGLFELKGAM